MALKVLRPEYAGKPAAEARFRREATTAARLRHPNIVFIRDVGEADGTVFVAMDLLPLSLERRLEVFPRLAEPEVVRFALEVAAALSIAHADGVVHRDIKPDNVMLGGNGEAIVADFGLAGAFTKEDGHSGFETDDTGKVMGTPHYFSPEQARGLDLDGRTDLYSLGVMCYRAATGRLPFEGDDWTSVARQHVEDTPVPPRVLIPELTEGFEAIVLRLLAKNPAHRFASATQLADALLTLPTAPTSRAVGLTTSSASITQVAFPYLSSVTSGSAWKRRALSASLAIAVVTVVSLFASQSLGVRPENFFGVERAPAAPIKLDTTPVTSLDSLPVANAAVKPPVATVKPPVKLAGATRATSAAGVVTVTFTAPDSARLLVNNQIRGYGSWTGDLLAGRELLFRARLDGAMAGCRSAEHDSLIKFTSEKTAEIELDVARCSMLLLEVRPPSNADWTITNKISSVEKSGRYPGKSTPIVLRNGAYRLQVRSEKCTDYSDTTLTIGRNPKTGSDTIPKLVLLECTTAALKR